MHKEFLRIYNRIIASYYIRNLIKQLKRYLKYCLLC